MHGLYDHVYFKETNFSLGSSKPDEASYEPSASRAHEAMFVDIMDNGLEHTLFCISAISYFTDISDNLTLPLFWD